MQPIEILADYGNGFVPVDVSFENLNFGMSIDSDFNLIKRRTFSQDLLFCGADAKKLIALENSCDRCDEIPISIRCGSELISGRMSLSNAEFNEDFCEVNMAIEPTDRFTCLYDNWEIPKNLCELPVYESSLSPEGIECEIIRGDEDPPDNSGTWNATSIDVFINGAGDDAIRIQWCREVVNSPTQPPGDGWIQIGPDQWARPVFWAGGGIPIDRENPNIELISVNEALQFLADDCDLTVCSNFYGINPDGTNPMNEAYECALRDLQGLHIYPKSNLKYPLIREGATICNKSLKDFLLDLRQMHNISFDIIDGKLVIEHVSYFNGARPNKNDLTTANRKECLNFTSSFNLSDFDIPQTETWSNVDETNNQFAPHSISYCGCYTRGLVNERKINCFNPDLRTMLADKEGISNDGFAIVSAEVVNGIVTVKDLNSAFYADTLVNCYWRDDMLHDCFTFNGQKYCANSVKRSKLQAVSIPMCCDEFAKLDFKEEFKTQYGWGELVDYNYNTNTECLEAVLAHSVFNCCEESECQCVRIAEGEAEILANQILVTPNDPNGRIIRTLNGDLSPIEDLIVACIKEFLGLNAIGGLTVVITSGNNTHVFANVTNVTFLTAFPQTLLELTYSGHESNCSEGLTHNDQDYELDSPAMFTVECFACVE